MTEATNQEAEMSPEELSYLQNLEGDEEYWDRLDEMEAANCGTREWDNASCGGAR